MKRMLALAGLAAVATVGLTACSTGTPVQPSSDIPAVGVQQTPVPNPSMTLVEGEVVPVEPATSEAAPQPITLADADKVIEMRVDERLPITGLPDDDAHHAAYVSTNRNDIVLIEQRVINAQGGAQSEPTIEGLAPGVALVTVYDTDPTGNGQKEVMSFTVHVQNASGAVMTKGLTGVALEIASGGMREGDAARAAEDAGFAVRIVSEDGKTFPMTMDYSDKRLNFTVEHGVVTAVTVG